VKLEIQKYLLRFFLYAPDYLRSRGCEQLLADLEHADVTGQQFDQGQSIFIALSIKGKN
jgi:hypothetical protein